MTVTIGQIPPKGLKNMGKMLFSRFFISSVVTIGHEGSKTPGFTGFWGDFQGIATSWRDPGLDLPWDANASPRKFHRAWL